MPGMANREDGNAGADGIHEYALSRLNDVLRKPGMFGGDCAIEIYMDIVNFGHTGLRPGSGIQSILSGSDAWTRLGVRGAFLDYWGLDSHDMTASVYAEAARERGWAALDRLLTAGEYETAAKGVSQWCKHDRSYSEVLAVYGEPSIHIGGNGGAWPKTLFYASEDKSTPCLSFHLWNARDTPSSEPLYSEAMLLGVRTENPVFMEGFILTPLGHTYKNVQNRAASSLVLAPRHRAGTVGGSHFSRPRPFRWSEIGWHQNGVVVAGAAHLTWRPLGIPGTGRVFVAGRADWAAWAGRGMSISTTMRGWLAACPRRPTPSWMPAAVMGSWLPGLRGVFRVWWPSISMLRCWAGPAGGLVPR
jgi:hypothetical protein